MRYCKLNLKNINNLKIISLAKKIAENIKDNPHFPDPPVLPSDLLNDANICSRLYGEKATGDKVKIVRFNEHMLRLKEKLRQLAQYIDMVAQGDEVIILSSGTDITRERTLRPVPMAPVKVVATYTGITACVALSWAKAKYGDYYVVEYKEETDDAAWQELASLTARKISVTGLQSGKKYYFRVVAYNNKGKGEYSGIVAMRAA